MSGRAGRGRGSSTHTHFGKNLSPPPLPYARGGRTGRGGRGHVENQTPLPASNQSTTTSNRKCGACGQPGHTRATATVVNCSAFNDPSEVERRRQKGIARTGTRGGSSGRGGRGGSSGHGGRGGSSGGRGRGRGRGAQNKTKDVAPWQYSRAKALLFSLLSEDDGTISQMEPSDIHSSCKLFQQYTLVQFRGYLSTMKEAIRKEKEAVEFDTKALAHDRNLYPVRPVDSLGRKRWDGSAAEKLLREDVKVSKQTTFPTSEAFWKSRPEYKEFDKKVFNKHVWQEYLRHVGRSYWMFKKGERDEKKRKRFENKYKQSGVEESFTIGGITVHIAPEGDIKINQDDVDCNDLADLLGETLKV